ncbi:MAG TPA: hypothetical protein VK541_17450 [Pedobacter sp.]|uniref:hypothetical protein n=1 Tax=Pedobacter sp. TaxID=1411316 RepID=UPI002CC36B18|nr:hypothetical protein [Pedobacter sp.]HMI04278.1 hypothetical protein [Pedobacter sp.]
MNKEKLPEGITQDMVDAAKTKWPKEGAVKFADLEMDDYGNILTVLVRRPCRTVMSEYSKWEKNSPKKADETLVKACLLSHKDQVMEDDDLFMAAVDAIAKMIKVRQATLKNI